jgi:ACT domain
MPLPRPIYASYLDAPPASATALATFTAEANLWVPNLWTPIPAQDMVPGRTYTLRCGGIMQSATAVARTLTPRFGGSATPATNLSLGPTSAEVLVVSVDDDRPGVLGEVSRKLGESGINITLAYLATNTRLVFAADDLCCCEGGLGLALAGTQGS